MRTLRHAPNRFALASLLLAAAFFAIACLGGSDGASEDSPPSDSYAELLRWIPEPEERAFVTFLSYSILQESIGTPDPSDPLDFAQVEAYMNTLFEVDGIALLPEFLDPYAARWDRMVENSLAYLALGPAHFTSRALAEDSEDAFYVAAGTFDPDSADRLLRACEGCPEPTEIGSHAGHDYYGWGRTTP